MNFLFIKSIVLKIKPPSGFFLAVSLFAFVNAQSQITQPARYEHPHKNSDHEFIVISMKERGLGLVRDTEKYEDGKKKWEVIILDSALQEKWQTTVLVDQRMNILGYDYQENRISLIFQDPDGTGKNVHLIELNVMNQTIKSHTFKPEVNIRLTHFLVAKDKAIFGGTIQREPALLMYDLLTETNKIIPGIVEPNLEMMDLRININDTFNAVLVEGRSAANKKLVVRTYDLQGVLLVEDVIIIDEGKKILDAITSSLVHDELLVVGTWTYGMSKNAAGFFSVTVDPFHEQHVTYYDLPELNHFLDFLKPKKAQRVRDKSKFRKSIGKPSEFRANITSIKIEETNRGFSFLSETHEENNSASSRYPSPYGYYPTGYSPYGYYPYGYSTMPYRYYMPYNSPYGNNYTLANDIRAISSSLIFFDKQGKMISDLSLIFPEIKISSKEQVSDFMTSQDSTIMVCKSEKEIVIKHVDNNGDRVREEKIVVRPTDDHVIIRSEIQDNSSIRRWYDNSFYVYGYQTLRNPDKKTLHVFYINKVKIN